MTHLRRAQLLAIPLLVIALATAACGGGDAGDGGNGTPEQAPAAPAAAACPIDEAALSEAIDVDMNRSAGASCGFVAASPQPGQLIEVYYTAIDPMVFDGSAGEAVAGVGDGARWDTQLSRSLLVKTGSRYFSVQAVAMGNLPDNLETQEPRRHRRPNGPRRDRWMISLGPKGWWSARRRIAILAAAALAAAMVPVLPGLAWAEEQVPFAITIRHISCVAACDEEGLEALLESTPDFYVKVFINEVKQPPDSDPDDPSSPRIEGDDSIDPMWTISTLIPASVVNVPVTIQVWDHDSTSGDDLGDASPRNNDNNLDFRVIRESGTWIDPTADGTGDGISSPQNCSVGNGGDDDEPAVKVCFDIGGDTDGDGLLDSWERNGYDDNADGIVDVDLPAMGANPECKDLFLELDESSALPANRQLTRADIGAMRAAFRAAPATAGSRAGEREGGGGEGGSEGTFGRSAPPDRPGCRGITLHVDTGTVVDETAVQGQAPGTCTDGIDNSGDGEADAADPDCTQVAGNVEAHLDASAEDPAAPDCAGSAAPDCLVGDAVFATPGLGGGGSIPDPMMCGLDRNFYNAKNNGGFNPARRHIFRYAIRADRATTCSGSSGGQGELGGNDFVSFNAGGGTLMHELGHTLNIFHGGFEHVHCKPNYVSVMNYNTQFGIPRVGGGTILDFSPPRVAVDGATRGKAPLWTLDEENLKRERPARSGRHGEPARLYRPQWGIGTSVAVPTSQLEQRRRSRLRR